jgi:hypothetical protein
MTWEFTCTLNRPVDEDSEIDLLMDAGLGHGAFAFWPAGVRVVNDAPALLPAVREAVGAIETVPGLAVTGIVLDVATLEAAVSQ